MFIFGNFLFLYNIPSYSIPAKSGSRPKWKLCRKCTEEGRIQQPSKWKTHGNDAIRPNYSSSELNGVYKTITPNLNNPQNGLLAYVSSSKHSEWEPVFKNRPVKCENKSNSILTLSEQKQLPDIGRFLPPKKLIPSVIPAEKFIKMYFGDTNCSLASTDEANANSLVDQANANVLSNEFIIKCQTSDRPR